MLIPLINERADDHNLLRGKEKILCYENSGRIFAQSPQDKIFEFNKDRIFFSPQEFIAKSSFIKYV